MANIIDTVLLVFLFLFALRGYFKGLFRESFSLVGIFIGFALAVRYHEPLSTFLKTYWNFPVGVLTALSFIVIFFAFYFTLNLAGWLLRSSAKLPFLRGLDRVGGILLGAGEGVAVLALILFLAGSSSFMSHQMKQKIGESYLIPPLHQFGQGLIRVGKDKLLPQVWSQAQVTGDGLISFGRSG